MGNSNRSLPTTINGYTPSNMVSRLRKTIANERRETHLTMSEAQYVLSLMDLYFKDEGPRLIECVAEINKLRRTIKDKDIALQSVKDKLMNEKRVTKELGELHKREVDELKDKLKAIKNILED